VVALTDSSGNIVNQYKYDPYGNAITATEQVSNPFRFAGAMWDSSTGLYKMGERYYDPAVGRFVTPDPLDGQDYTYAGNNPINVIDPSGLSESLVSESGGAQPPATRPGAGAGVPETGSGDAVPTASPFGETEATYEDTATRFKYEKIKGKNEYVTKDKTGHGGSRYKVYRREGRYLVHEYDTDEHGRRLPKHKGPRGQRIPFKRLKRR
jgi:RHS repeat-associated protein